MSIFALSEKNFTKFLKIANFALFNGRNAGQDILCSLINWLDKKKWELISKQQFMIIIHDKIDKIDKIDFALIKRYHQFRSQAYMFSP